MKDRQWIGYHQSHPPLSLPLPSSAHPNSWFYSASLSYCAIGLIMVLSQLWLSGRKGCWSPFPMVRVWADKLSTRLCTGYLPPLCAATRPDMEVRNWWHELLLVPHLLCPSPHPGMPSHPTQKGCNARKGCTYCSPACVAVSGWPLLSVSWLAAQHWR